MYTCVHHIGSWTLTSLRLWKDTVSSEVEARSAQEKEASTRIEDLTEKVPLMLCLKPQAPPEPSVFEQGLSRALNLWSQQEA